MIVAAESKDIYGSFDPGNDTYFFRIGGQGLVSFHGRNYNITKKLSAEQRMKLLRNSAFVRITSNCYVNINKVCTVEKGHIRFVEPVGSTMLSVPVWRMQLVRQRISERQK